MPLTMAKAGESSAVKRLGGKPEIRRHLENLGFVVGAPVAVVASHGGDMIVNVRESRVAISREMACKIMI